MKHNQIVKELLKKYKADKNVVGIYLFGSLARGNAHLGSDIDIEIIFKKKKKKYELLHPKLDEKIHIDLSLYREDKFIEATTKTPYLLYADLPYKILYDPEKLLKKHLGYVKKYFASHPEIKNFWKEKEKKWSDMKKKGKKGTAENYFDIARELGKKI